MEKIKTINPYNGKQIAEYDQHSSKEINQKLENAQQTFEVWKKEEISDRVELLKSLSDLLIRKKEELAELITTEMGKPIKQSISEIEKCAWACDFYAINADNFLADALIETEAQESFISYDPLGCILAVMPWNFPFWQVFRFAAPTVTAGNTAILKHASNTTGCAIAIQNLFEEVGYPKGCFQTILADHNKIEKIIENDIIKAVTLTGSEKAGRRIASIAGENLKKTVLELGGNNACIIWEDANLETYIDAMVNSRMSNAGQSCIAAKRFIVAEAIYDRFLEMFTAKVNLLKTGNPMDKDTDIATLARPDLAKKVQEQVNESLIKGAEVHLGNTCDNAFYEPTIITNVKEGMPLFDEEVFGPVAAIIKVKDRSESIKVASNTKFGLGTMLFTEDIEKARMEIGNIDDGSFFINELTKSDPRLPFGGTKISGYGRELSKEGMLEFLNKKTVYIK
ncbi:NAD-dependent succinate-semialdehyde dehydrogenase [Aureibaculum sp. 2210JD6-5]|uniref:NAD-dependent succinate-semialdehyde dehydrogenase n=1 Tax=Aureibaculum sp. 2210JD6-5 TaxID=3103957 RepID=UPI002AAEA10D|nr:NAD-dependent succinate-semialdehyde dehydrogenase [Aureibaculum sp. 2210JD6-5]MDY7394970.1 NAD-dependent succinate-semialdehyde dehydrogenase [Aureibaculum sp. 2210JD6-5]